jgi:protein SCO1/2
MNKGAVLGLVIALMIPLACYFVMKQVGEHAVEMPRHYYLDTVISSEKEGKIQTDTVWHRIKNFTFTDQLGEPFSLDSVKGKIIILNSFFTRCPNICPALTRSIRNLQASYENPKNKKYDDTSAIQFISLSVDPDRDSVHNLKQFADRFNVNSDNWRMLTGPKKDIYDILLNEVKIPSQDGGLVDSNFIHSGRVILLDKNHVLRGYYDGLDSSSMYSLAQDIGKLVLEKDRNKPSIFREYLPILPLLISVPVLVFVVMLILSRQRKKMEGL